MKRHAPHFVVVGLLIVALLTGADQYLRNLISDVRYSVAERNATGDVVVVAIDPVSLQQIGIWPWPRRLHAEILTKLSRIGVSEIAFDIDFSAYADAASDTAFSEALREAGGSVILPAFKQWAKDGGPGVQTHENTPLPIFAQHAWPALVNVRVDDDGIVRRYLYGESIGGRLLPSLAAMLAGRSTVSNGSFLIDFGIRHASIPRISFASVLNRDEGELNWLAGKKVIVGATALELGDRMNVPHGRVLSGVVVQALAAESILQGRALHATSWILGLAGSLAIVLLMSILWSRMSYWPRAGILAALAVLVEFAAIAVQDRWPFAPDTSLLQLALVGYLAIGAVHEIDVRGLLSRIAEGRFQRMATSVSDGLVCVDRAGLITFWNPSAAALFDYEAGEALGKPLSMVLAGEDHHTTLLSKLQSSSGSVLELEGCRRDGLRFPLEIRFFAWEGVDGAEFGVLMRDISEKKREADRINYLARVDAVTGLANRHALRDHLDAKLAHAAVDQKEVAVLVLDLDRFKEINDSLGHTSGDELLALVGAFLRDILGDRGFIARFGGDEFALVLDGEDIWEAADRLSREICGALKRKVFSVHGRDLQVRSSIGIAIYPRDASSPEELLSNADYALYQAKSRGGGEWSFFTQEIGDEVATRLSLQAELERALREGEFELFYQPKVSLADRQLVGVESLIRWRHPQRGLLLPGEFMRVVHTSAYSNDVAWWVLETACRQAASWIRGGREIRVAVNLSPSQLQTDGMVDRVAATLRKHNLPASLVELEVTEDTLLSDDRRALEIFNRLRGIGVRLSFDDFGTGFGSLSYLRKFPFDRLKIDRSFVAELRNRHDDVAIVNSTIMLGRQLGLTVIAEGIEDEHTAELLTAMGCDEGQGYHFGRPMPAADLEKWIDNADMARTPRVDAA